MVSGAARSGCGPSGLCGSLRLRPSSSGFRIGLNVETPRGVIDVGYAGVIGASRIVDGQAPYGHMPIRGDLKPCGSKDADGDVRDRIQANGRCESANDHGDTYGPVSYLGYVPAYLAFGWSGKWDSLPAAHATSIAFDLLTVLGLVLVGLRFGGSRLAAALAFAWAAYPFTAYTLNANTNDTFMSAFLVWGFWLATSPVARGTSVALAGWSKFGALLLVPLWASYPTVRVRTLRVVRGSLCGDHCPRCDRSAARAPPVGGRADVLGAHDRIPARSRLTVLPLGVGAVPRPGDPRLRIRAACARRRRGRAVARRRGLSAAEGVVELAALTAAVLMAFQLSLSHWFYLYLPWFFPFVALWLLLPESAHRASESRQSAANSANEVKHLGV